LRDESTGRLRDRMPMDTLLVGGPVHAKSGHLVFAGKELKLVRVPGRLLESFLALAGDEAIVRFAQRFGPLAAPDPGLVQNAEVDYRTFHPVWRRTSEEIGLWRHYQWEFDLLLHLAAALADDQDIKRDPIAEFSDRQIDLQPDLSARVSLSDFRAAYG